jgi:hypothetical protein
MSTEQRQVSRGFLIWWTGLTLAGGLAGNFIADRLGLGVPGGRTDDAILLSMLASGLFALCVSLAQWVLLRRLFSGAAAWLLAGTLGRAFGMLVGSMAIVIMSHLFGLQAGLWSSAVYLGVRAAVLGLAQWLVLKQWRTKAGWWVLGSAIGWALGPTLVTLFIPSVAASAPLVGDLSSLAIAGATTGAFMMWIMRQPGAAPATATVGSRLIVAWISIWALSWGVSWAVGWTVMRAIISAGYILEGGKFGGMIAGAIAGLIGGVGTAIVVKRASPFHGLRIYHLILLAVGWAGIVYYDWLDGFVVAGIPVSQNNYGLTTAALAGHEIGHGIAGPLSGAAGGILMALILLWAVRSLDWKQLGGIVLGWALGFAVGGWIAWTIGFQIAVNYANGRLYANGSGIGSLILFTLVSLVCGAFAGWSGAAATLAQFPRSPAPTANLLPARAGSMKTQE